MANAILPVPTWLEFGDRLTGDNDPVYGANGSANSNARTLLLSTQGIGTYNDTLYFTYTSASTVTVQPGVCWSDDETQGYHIDTVTVIDMTSDFANGESESSSTPYYIWVGENSSNALEFVISANHTTVPNEQGSATQLGTAHRLRQIIYNDGSSDLLAFNVQPKTGLVWYDEDILCGGSDVTEVRDASTTTSFVDVDCSSFVPQGVREVYLAQKNTAGGSAVFYRFNGSSISSGYGAMSSSSSVVAHDQVLVDANGIVEVAISGATVTLRVSVIGYKI